MKSPNATPPNAECAKASPNKENFLKTKKRPIALQSNEMAIPDISACGIDSYATDSKVIVHQ